MSDRNKSKKVRWHTEGIRIEFTLPLPTRRWWLPAWLCCKPRTKSRKGQAKEADRAEIPLRKTSSSEEVIQGGGPNSPPPTGDAA